MNLEGKVAVVTGGGSGIGLALTRALRAAGSDVLIVGRTEARLRAARGDDPHIDTLTIDVANADDRARLVRHLRTDMTPDILINNAGTMTPIDLRDPNAQGMMSAEIEIDLLAPMHLSIDLLPLLASRPEAAIVNVSTGLIYAPFATHPGYSAAKAGLHAFTQALRRQTRQTPIRVLEVMPPTVDTGLTHDFSGSKIKPQAIGKAVVKALSKDRTEIRVGQSKLLYPMSRAMPNGIYALLNRMADRQAATR